MSGNRDVEKAIKEKISLTARVRETKSNIKQN